MIKDKDIDKLFREKLKDYEQQPPAYLLENILAAASAAKRKRTMVFWRIAAVAAALLLAFIAGWQVNYMNREGMNQPVVISKNTIPQAKESMKAASREPRFLTAHKSPQETSTKNDSEKNRDPRFVTVYKSAQGTSSKNNNLASITADKSQQATSDQKDRTAQPATPINPNDKNSLPETTTTVPTAESVQPKLITPKINPNDQNGNAQQEKKVDNSTIESAEQTIDQQIIAQNQAQLLALNEKRKEAHWLVGAQVSPAYSVNRSNHSAQYASNMLSSSSNTPIALGGGLTVEYKKGKRWSLQSGIYYAGLGQSTGNSALSNNNHFALTGKGSEYFNAPADIESSNMLMNSTAGVIEFNGIPKGIELGTNLEDKSLATAVVVSDTRFIQNFQYLEIPLYLRYTVLDARFDVELMGGFSSNVLIGNDTYLQDRNGKTLVGKTQDMQGLNYSGTMGLGLKYGVSRRIYLNLEPRIKYYLNSLNTNSAVNYKPYTIGVYTGISYQF
ncbi:MAG TPA: hypothetical protein DCL77_15745 [Prolixibacteraceae bacterium]|jgi:hypothetical protein|nr:hypothetical protein [Prolixibacteraceae bacterium]